MGASKHMATSTHHTEEKTDQEHIDDFHGVINMTGAEIKKWLETAESKEVGQKSSEGAESTGHESGRHIIEILGKKKGEYDEADIDQMKRTVSYVRRHMAQKPDGDIKETHWRYSLMNWGHDPLKA